MCYVRARRRSAWCRALGLAAAIAVATSSAACADVAGPASPSSSGPRLLVGDPTQMSGVVLRVSGPGIPDTLVTSIGMLDATGHTSPRVVALPVGPSRVFVGRAFYDAQLTHEGTVTAAVTRQSRTVTMHLRSLIGGPGLDTALRDIQLRVDTNTSYALSVTAATIARGRVVPLTVRITRTALDPALGYTLGDPVANVWVSWGSGSRAVARVLAGSCRTDLLGSCTVRVLVPSRASAGDTTSVLFNTGGTAASLRITTS